MLVSKLLWRETAFEQGYKVLRVQELRQCYSIFLVDQTLNRTQRDQVLFYRETETDPSE